MATAESVGSKRKLSTAETGQRKRSRLLCLVPVIGIVTDKTYRIDYTDTITAVVGKEEEHFTIHEHALTTRSDYFGAACANGWKENAERTVYLPEANPTVFRGFLDWLYAPSGNLREIVDHAVEEDLADEPDYHRASDNCGFMCGLWLLADYLGVVELKNEIVDELLSLSATVTHACFDALGLVWELTTESSGLRRWLLDYCASITTLKRVEEYAKDYPAELMFELLKRLAPRTVGQSAPVCGRPTFADRCKYHEHAEGEGCGQ